MNQAPSFSIIIPTYNRAALIEATLQSVLQQTYRHYEVIVVDNCSTDNTEEVLLPYIQAGQVTFIKHDQNYERARSRNTGMDAAKGDFVTFLDSDDLMYANNLEDAGAFALANPEIKCFHNLYEFVDENREVIWHYPVPSLKNQLKAIAQGNFMTCIGDFIHREIYRRYRFDTNSLVTGGEDWDFWLRVLADYKVGRIEKVNSGIVQHGGRSVNSQNIKSMRAGLEYMVNKIKTDPHLANIYRRYIKYIEANSLIYLAVLANSSRVYNDALKYLYQAFSKSFNVLTTPRFIRATQIALFRLNGKAP
jgi:glycosyltransferase involved in cell wall biosynthesis